MEETKKFPVTEQIQAHIDQGRKILIKEEKKKTEVRIRFNNLALSDNHKWRVILNGNEFFCKDVIIKIPCKTLALKVEPLQEIKYFIGCDADEIIFENNIAIVANYEVEKENSR